MVRKVVAMAAAVSLLAAACDGGGDPSASPTPRDTLTASPEETPAPGPSASDLPAPGPSSSASPSPSESDGEALPTDTDRARFIATYQPAGSTDLEHAAADVDGDGVEEIVFVYVRTGARVSRVDVAWWDGEAYAVEWSDDGGPAERIDRLRISDVNADGRIEVVVSQAVGSSGASMTLWRANEGVRSLQPLIASGGCHSGSNTYGVIGAELRNSDDDPALELFATCDDSPLPPAAWDTDVYDWTNGSYAYLRTEFGAG